MTVKVDVKMHGAAWGAANDESAFETALRIIGVAFGEEGGWNSKYGADFENDVFLMKRFCWCEREGECPWCTGCGIYQERGCEACTVAHSHRQDCFREELQRRFAAYDEASGYNAIESALYLPGMMDVKEEIGGAGFRTIVSRRSSAGEIAHNEWSKAHDAQTKAREDMTRTLYQERGLTPEKYQWLCDCGSEAAGEAMRKAGKGCDYQNGGGIFARFAPYQHLPDRRYYDPPNFWYKPTNFRVTWYKYIGRDMASNQDTIPDNFMEHIFATHPKKMTVEEAVQLFEAETSENRAAFARIIQDVNARL